MNDMTVFCNNEMKMSRPDIEKEIDPVKAVQVRVTGKGLARLAEFMAEEAA